MNDLSALTNHFLIAMPSMSDPNFANSVIYICEHNKQGATGIIINKPVGVQLQEVFVMDGENYISIEIYNIDNELEFNL